jgi:hypothetical protein
MKIKLVDGFKIRNTIDPNFGGHFTSDYAPYIPPGEVWIEDCLKAEEDFLLHIVKMEQEFFAQKKSFEELREYLKKEMQQKGPPPKFEFRREKKGDLEIVYVDGQIVRSYLDPYFVAGGHGLVYEYIPKNEVWIDARNYEQDQPFVVIHELFERDLVAKGRDYASAHDFAMAEEKHHRRLAGVADFLTG